ncbi:MAG TPA: hypothetical protein VMF08_05495 [Candidatus Sulfotelmatobacter sp.]|nr:hypothetical protein [Candidatus Sulfotelmatobacter sp.]
MRLDEVAWVYTDTTNSIRFYYDSPNLQLRDSKFVGYTIAEIRKERDDRLCEVERSAVFNVLAALEASFRIDYLKRCYQKRKDELSRHFRDVHKRDGNRVHLEECILDAWKQHVSASKALISKIIGAFKYRHWLAHGRYWEPKLGQQYDYLGVYLLAQEMELVFQEQRLS